MSFVTSLPLSGCGYTAQHPRGRQTDVGTHLSVQECMNRCDAAGPAVCQTIEYGNSGIGYSCRLWSGTCQQENGMNSTMFVRNATYGSTYVQNYQAAGTTNFNNSANKGDTKVDNLSGLAGSVQNFGLMNLADLSLNFGLMNLADLSIKDQIAAAGKLVASLKKDVAAKEKIYTSLTTGQKSELAKEKATLAALTKQAKTLCDKDELLDKEIDEKEWQCPAGSNKKYCRVLNADEADCFWMNYTDSAKDFSAQGLQLNAKNASFNWNFAANQSPAVKKSVYCSLNPEQSIRKTCDAIEDKATAKQMMMILLL